MTDQPTYRIPHYVCPACGRKIKDDSVWLVKGKFYCSEDCVKKKGTHR